MVKTRRWLLAVLVLSLVCSVGLAEGDSADWKTLQAGDLCLRFPADWFDMTPLVDVLEPEFLADAELEGLDFGSVIIHVHPFIAGKPTALFLLFADEASFHELLPSLVRRSRLIDRIEGLVAGEPGVYEQYELDASEGSSWLAYTDLPRSDGRHVVLLALSPIESPVPETVIREMLLSVGPCPPPPPVPPCVPEERVATLERELQELRRAHQAEIDTLRDWLAALDREVGRLRLTRELRIGVVDAEALFTRVFLPQVQMERAAMEAEAREIQTLQADYAAGKIPLAAYQQRYLRLQAELIQASLHVNLTMLEKMIASPGFLNLRSDLEAIRTQASPLSDEVAKTVREAQVTILDMQGFSERLRQLQTAFQQLDDLLTQVAAVKIVEVTQQVALAQGYDLAIRTKDVVMFRSPTVIIDLSSEVEPGLWALFRSK